MLVVSPGERRRFGFDPWCRPRTSLFFKGHDEQFQRSEFLGITVGRNADHEQILRDVESNGAMETIPAEEQIGVVAIGFTVHDRMVNTMSTRRHDETAEHALERKRESEIAVVKLSRGFEADLVDQCGHGTGSDDEYLKGSNAHAEKHFAKMKTKRGRHIQIEIAVVHIVKTPEERHLMIEPVPTVHGIIEQQKRADHPDRARKAEPVDQAKPMAL